jgi:hypothetical protein
MANKNEFYADLLMRQWGLDNQSAKFQREVRAVLMELDTPIQLLLRNEPRLQVEVVKGWGPETVWAYFPMYKARSIAKRFRLKSTTRVLLVLGSRMFHERTRRITGQDATHHLRDHLGHALLYLRQPKARNECLDAEREWKDCSACPSSGAAHYRKGRGKKKVRP